MPPSPDTIIKKVCSTIDVLVSYKQMMINKAIVLQSFEQSATDTWADEVDEFDVDELPPEDGLWRTKWHVTEQTREVFEVGKSMCKFAGIGYQELCVRASRCDLPCPLNDVEWLAVFIDECLQTFASSQRQESRSKSVRYHRMYGPEADSAFPVRMTEVLKQDCLGRTVCTRYVFSPCSADEYDQAVRQTPIDCRPLLGAMGLQDTRSGQALLDAGKSDFHIFKMSTLVQSPQGRAFLDQFACVIETAMTPVFAGIICICIYIRTCVCVRMCVCVWGGVYACTCSVCIHMYVFIRMSTYAYTRMNLNCMYMSITGALTYTHAHTSK